MSEYNDEFYIRLARKKKKIFLFAKVAKSNGGFEFMILNIFINEMKVEFRKTNNGQNQTTDRQQTGVGRVVVVAAAVDFPRLISTFRLYSHIYIYINTIATILPPNFFFAII